MDLEHVVRRIAADLERGEQVAVGFEAPTFVPVPREVCDLGRARSGEVRDGVSRPWNYGPGAYVSTLLLQLGAWVLREVRAQLTESKRTLKCTTDLEAWNASSPLLLWEAFVSGPSHAGAVNVHGMNAHVQDAATATIAFQQWLGATPNPGSAVTASPCLSTIGAIAIWSGWSNDQQVLSMPSIVIWPTEVLGMDVTADSPDSPLGEPDDAQEDDFPSTSLFSITCGDTHSFWRSHQQTASAFNTLTGLLTAATTRSRLCDVSFDQGATWRQLRLSLVSEAQVSWPGYNAAGRSDARIEALIRI